MHKLELFKGLKDKKNNLNILDGNLLVCDKIFRNVDNWYNSHIEYNYQSYSIINEHRESNLFPESTGININMMPIRYFDLNKSLPKNLDGYRKLIQSCPVIAFDFLPKKLDKVFYRHDRIVYLTIHESIVSNGKTQRRPGIHIERPLAVKKSGTFYKREDPYNFNSEYHSLAWGLGYRCPYSGIPVDGIYMASNQDNSCEVYPCTIKNPSDFTDRHGGLEHARDYLRNGKKLMANQICWMTDSTPHESLPVNAGLNKKVQRSYFRLVAGDISIWYSKHNTPNPLGTQPDCPISDIDKFQ